MFGKIAIIGIGLIGSSLCKVIKKEGLAKVVSAYDKDSSVCIRAKALKLADIVTNNIIDAVNNADMIIVAVPVGVCGIVVSECIDNAKVGSIIIDVGSVKSSIISSVKPYLRNDVHFIPCHPVAGTEHSGPEAGEVDLFRNRWCLLTPEGICSDENAINIVKQFWENCGANVELMSPGHHDLALAVTSHVPHLIAYNIVGTAADLEDVTKSEIIKFSAGGFRDFTRIAASDPVMWRDIFLNNREAVLEILGRFNEDLTKLQRAIRDGDGKSLQEQFTRTREIRLGIIDAGQD